MQKVEKLAKPRKAAKLVKPAPGPDEQPLSTQCELCGDKFTHATIAAAHVSQEHGD